MMAEFANIVDGVVVNVIVIADADCGGGTFPASEPIGQAFIASLNLNGEWKQTSLSGAFRGRYGSIGYTFNAEADVFIAPQPYSSWSLNSNHDWQPPTPRPTIGNWSWNESALAWVEITI